MKRSDLIKVVGARTGLPRAEVARVLDASFDAIVAELADGADVAIHRFGTFRTVDISGSTRPDPNSGKPVKFPATKTARWRPSRLVRDRLLGSDSSSESVPDA